MTTQKVSELSSYFLGGISNSANQGTVSGSSSAEFSNMMNKAQSKDVEYVSSSKNTKKDSFQGRSGDIVNECTSGSGRVKDMTSQAGVDDLDRDTLEEELVNAASQITEVIKEELSVTDEDIQEAMETLGLSLVDLFDKNALQQLYTQLSPAEDSLALITDEALYGSFKEVLLVVDEVVSDLKAELSLNDEEFNAVLEELDVAMKEGNISDSSFFDAKIGNTDGDKDAVAVAEDTLEDEPVIIVKDERDNNKADAIKEAKPEEMKTSEAEDAKPVTEIKHQDNKNNNRGSENSSQDGNMQGMFTEASYSTGQSQEVYGTDALGTFSGYGDVNQAQMITRQLVSQIEVRLTAETTQMQMELNPESLGRVGLTIEARNGIITAQFTAQNEAVRAAIESQVTVLQEALEEQGVKVEAVEVAIASHEFEENLHKNDEGKRQEEEARKAMAVAGRRARRINLMDEESEDSETLEELSEEDEINLDMMRRNGNTVDYTV